MRYSAPVIFIGLLMFIGCGTQKPLRLDDNPYNCSWSQPGGGPDHTAYSLDNQASGTAISEPAIRWKKTQKTPLLLEPTIGVGVIFVPYSDDKIQIMSLKSGARIGQLNLKSPASAPIVVYDSVIAVNEAGHQLSVQNWVTGKRLWEVDLKGQEVGPLLNEGVLYWQDGTGLMKAYEITEGRRIWERKLDYRISAAPSAAGDYIVLVSRDGGIECLSALSGNTIWKANDISRIRNSPVIFGGTVLYCSADGKIGKLDITDGTKIWEVDHYLPLMGPLATDGQGVYLGTADNRILRVNYVTGSVDWEIKGEGPFKAGGTVSGNFIVFVGLNRAAYFVDKNTGTVKYEFETKGMLSVRPVACLNRIYIAGEDRNLYCFQVTE